MKRSRGKKIADALGVKQQNPLKRPGSQEGDAFYGNVNIMADKWKDEIKKAGEHFARGKANLPMLSAMRTFDEAAQVLDALIPYFAWIMSAPPRIERDEMKRMGIRFEEWQALKSFPRILCCEGLPNAYVLAQLGVLFAAECLLSDHTLMRDGFMLQKEHLALRSFRVHCCDMLKPHIADALRRFAEIEDFVSMGLKKVWHYANTLYQECGKPFAMRRMFQRGDAFTAFKRRNAKDRGCGPLVLCPGLQPPCAQQGCELPPFQPPPRVHPICGPPPVQPICGPPPSYGPPPPICYSPPYPPRAQPICGSPPRAQPICGRPPFVQPICGPPHYSPPPPICGSPPPHTTPQILQGFPCRPVYQPRLIPYSQAPYRGKMPAGRRSPIHKELG